MKHVTELLYIINTLSNDRYVLDVTDITPWFKTLLSHWEKEKRIRKAKNYKGLHYEGIITEENEAFFKRLKKTIDDNFN